MIGRQVKLRVHLLFWAGYILLSGLSFSSMYPLSYAFSRTLVASAFFALVTYANVFWLIPYYLTNRKYAFYVFLLLLVVLVCTVLRLFTQRVLLPEIPVDFLLTKDGLRNKPFNFAFSANLIAALFSTLLQFGVDWFDNIRTQEALRNEKLSAELKFLKVQLSPHFLFNTLNNIYTLAYLKEDNAAPMIMRLSDSMRYMLHECNETTVPLEREIHFLEGFVALGKLKSETMNITFTTHGIRPTHRIAPLLLLPFFENVFKHSDVDTNPEGWVDVNLAVDETNQLCFRMTNTKRKSPSNQREASGIGLDNVRKRLVLLYPQRHRLITEDQSGIFSVHLDLKL